ncbi:MAG TPA: PHP domain-containing protein [Candidatus Limnocylindrales bacterium]|nr:PHP domain-containing protein [Candidatus Limnocylindrales bacterium]
MREPATPPAYRTATDASQERHEWARGPMVVPPGPSPIDLHTHTLRSDGILTPEALVGQAAAVGVRLLSITDHDTLAGVRELRRSGLPAGLELLPGVEINAVAGDRADLRDEEIHVLGIGVDADDDAFEAVLAAQRDSRRQRFDRMVDRLRELELPIDRELEDQPATDDEHALGRPRVARAMMQCGYVTSLDDAFNRYLSRGRPAYVPRDGIGPIEAIRIISAARGVPVLAHFAEAPRRMDVIRELMAAGLRGLEVFYRTYDQGTVEILRSIAVNLRLVATGGSDYHGDRETYAQAHAQLWVPPAVEAPLRAAMATAAEAAA